MSGYWTIGLIKEHYLKKKFAKTRDPEVTVIDFGILTIYKLTIILGSPL